MDWRRDGDGDEDGNDMFLPLLLSTCDSGNNGICNEDDDNGSGNGGSSSGSSRGWYFQDCLKDFIWNIEQFLWTLRQEIIRAQHNKGGVDLSGTGALVGDNDFSPTENRENAGHKAAIEAAEGALNENDLGEDDCEDIDDTLFRTMNRRVPKAYNWYANFNEQTSTALPRLAKQFYKDQMTVPANDGQQPLKLFNKAKH